MRSIVYNDWVRQLASVFRRVLNVKRGSREEAFATFSVILIPYLLIGRNSVSLLALDYYFFSEHIVPLLDEIGLGGKKQIISEWLNDKVLCIALNDLSKTDIGVRLSIEKIASLFEQLIDECIYDGAENAKIESVFTELMIGLLELRKGERIADPSCGKGDNLLAALMMGLDYDQLIAEESNLALLVICRIRMWLRHLNPERVKMVTTVTSSDVFAESSFDAVITQPKFDDWARSMQIDKKSLERTLSVPILHEPLYVYLLRCISLLKKDGRMAIVLPSGFLVSKETASLRATLLQYVEILAIIVLPAVKSYSRSLTAVSRCLLVLRKGVKPSVSQAVTFLARVPIIQFRTAARMISEKPSFGKYLIERYKSKDYGSDSDFIWSRLHDKSTWLPNAIYADDVCLNRAISGKNNNIQRLLRVGELFEQCEATRSYSSFEIGYYVENTPLGIVRGRPFARQRQFDFFATPVSVAEVDTLLVSSYGGSLLANIVEKRFDGMAIKAQDQCYRFIENKVVSTWQMAMQDYVALMMKSKRYMIYLRYRLFRDLWKEDFLNYIIPMAADSKVKEYHEMHEDFRKRVSAVQESVDSHSKTISKVFQSYLGYSESWKMTKGNFYDIVNLSHLWNKDPRETLTHPWKSPILRNIILDRNLVDEKYVEGLFVSGLLGDQISDVLKGRVPWGFVRQFAGRALIPIPPRNVQVSIVSEIDNDLDIVRDGMVQLQNFARHNPVAELIDMEVMR